ncbi:hypothetical protein ACOJUR_13440 [Alicyclobacillus tolerans]|nr:MULTISPECIES: hypothetical protein [Alicyclobacillus]QRF24128.1 hypothetical protein FY534_11150 [Alicyclobacillus sp. TC]
MKLGVNIEYEGKNYDILELPSEAFTSLIPGLTVEQFQHLDKMFQPYWHDPTVRRNHILQFAAEILGTSLDYLFMNQETVRFTKHDVEEYIEHYTKQGNRPS